MKRKLALVFLKIGLFTFGGGYAMVPLLAAEFVTGRKWIGEEEFLDIISIAESTPGPIAINMATYIGYKMAGIGGAAVSTVAVCIPSFVIIYLISLLFQQFMEFTYVQYAFRGIQACVVYLIFSAGVRMLRALEKSGFQKTVLLLLRSVCLRVPCCRSAFPPCCAFCCAVWRGSCCIRESGQGIQATV